MGEADDKVICGKWVLEPHKARYVLRGFEENVKDEDVFASTTMTASVRMLLSPATDLKSEGHTVFTADVKTAFLNASMKDSEVVCANPQPEWQRETPDPQKGKVIWEGTEKSLWSDKRVETLARPSGEYSQQVWIYPEHAGHVPVDSQRSNQHSHSTRTTCCWLERTRSLKTSSLN